MVFPLFLVDNSWTLSIKDGEIRMPLKVYAINVAIGYPFAPLNARIVFYE
jgi:hypothetical protein